MSLDKDQASLTVRMVQVMLGKGVWTKARLTVELAERGWLLEDGSTADATRVESLLTQGEASSLFQRLDGRPRWVLTSKARRLLPPAFKDAGLMEPEPLVRRTAWERLLGEGF